MVESAGDERTARCRGRPRLLCQPDASTTPGGLSYSRTNTRRQHKGTNEVRTVRELPGAEDGAGALAIPIVPSVDGREHKAGRAARSLLVRLEVGRLVGGVEARMRGAADAVPVKQMSEERQ